MLRSLQRAGFPNQENVPMKQWSYLALVCVLVAAGCGEQASNEATNEEALEVGSLQMSLTGVDADSRQYRLRGATFDISGTRYNDFQSVHATLSSEGSADGPTLSTRLVYGYYSVALLPDGWYLERITSEGAERVERALLLSSPAQNVSIQQGFVSQVGFQFGVDGDVIDFYSGGLDITIGIQHAPDAGAGG
jgi:hypothetical protein